MVCGDSETDNSKLKVCRFCLQEEEKNEVNEEYYFVNPCYCKGSCEYVHIYCLKQWISNKVVKKMCESVTQYKMKKFECEVCQAPLPKSVFVNKKSFNIIDFEKPDNIPHLILECLNPDKKHSKTLYILKAISNEPIKLVNTYN